MVVIKRAKYFEKQGFYIATEIDMLILTTLYIMQHVCVNDLLFFSYIYIFLLSVLYLLVGPMGPGLYWQNLSIFDFFFGITFFCQGTNVY